MRHFCLTKKKAQKQSVAARFLAQITTLWSWANADNLARRLWSGVALSVARNCSSGARCKLRIIILTGPTEEAVIGRMRKPTPIRAIASRGEPALSPHRLARTLWRGGPSDDHPPPRPSSRGQEAHAARATQGGAD